MERELSDSPKEEEVEVVKLVVNGTVFQDGETDSILDHAGGWKMLFVSLGTIILMDLEVSLNLQSHMVLVPHHLEDQLLQTQSQ